MASHRPFDEHLVLFAAFTARVSDLAAPAWMRIEGRCATLSEPSFEALLARAALTAKTHELWLPEGARQHRLLEAIQAGASLLQRGFAIAGEVFAEFDSWESGSDVPASFPSDHAAPRSHDPRVAAFVEGCRRLDTALLSRKTTHPGVVAVVRAAGEAVLRHDWLPPEAFAAIYCYVEPEIPFASLVSPPDLPAPEHATATAHDGQP